VVLEICHNWNVLWFVSLSEVIIECTFYVFEDSKFLWLIYVHAYIISFLSARTVSTLVLVILPSSRTFLILSTVNALLYHGIELLLVSLPLQ